MKIIYLHHDCFLLRFDGFALLTDWHNAVGAPEELPIAPDERLYLLVSHHHKDHFSQKALGLWRRFAGMRYIVSRDVAAVCRSRFSLSSGYRGPNRADPGRVTVLGLHEVYADGYLSVKAFGSTDIGNSYLIEAQGKRIFFAGDLNLWRSDDRAMRQAYSDVLDDIAGECRECDVAFFPVDPRFGDFCGEGGRLFCRRLRPELFVPMHFELCDGPSGHEAYAECVRSAGTVVTGDASTRYLPLLQRGEEAEV